MQGIVRGGQPERETGSPRSARQRERERDTVTVMVNGAVDGERYEGQVVQAVCESNQKCVFGTGETDWRLMVPERL